MSNQHYTFIHLFTRNLYSFLYSTPYFCFPTSQRNAKMYEEMSTLYNWRIQVLFLSPLFLPFLVYFSFFCLSPFSFGLPHSDLYISFCAWLCLVFLLFIFLFQPSCVFVVQKIPHISYSNYRRTETPSLFFGTLVNA